MADGGGKGGGGGELSVLPPMEQLERTFGAGVGAGRYAIQKIVEALESEAFLAAQEGDPKRQRWVQDALKALEDGCPAAQMLTLWVWDTSFAVGWGEGGFDRAAALGLELEANAILSTREDFGEGVECAVGAKRKQRPQWQHGCLEEVANDMQVLAFGVRLQNPLETRLQICERYPDSSAESWRDLICRPLSRFTRRL